MEGGFHMKRLILVAFSFLLGSPLVTPALAGIADSPLPVLMAGETTLHLYSVPGVIRATGLATFFSCTSTDTASMQVGVEVFASAGGAPINDPVATSLSVAPGATVIFGSVAVGISISSDLGVGSISKGSARVLATSRKLVCTAFVADQSNAPPTSSWQLNILKKKTQKGD